MWISETYRKRKYPFYVRPPPSIKGRHAPAIANVYGKGRFATLAGSGGRLLVSQLIIYKNKYSRMVILFHRTK